MKNFEIIFYEAINGECPIEEFLNSLDKKNACKVNRNDGNSGRKGKYAKRTL